MQLCGVSFHFLLDPPPETVQDEYKKIIDPRGGLVMTVFAWSKLFAL